MSWGLSPAQPKSKGRLKGSETIFQRGPGTWRMGGTGQPKPWSGAVSPQLGMGAAPSTCTEMEEGVSQRPNRGAVTTERSAAYWETKPKNVPCPSDG